MKCFGECAGCLMLFLSYLTEVRSDLGFNLEPTTMSSLESLSADTTSGEVTAAQYVSLPYSSSEHHNNKPSVIQPSFTQSFIGERNNKSTLNRNVYPSQTLNTAQDSYKNIGKDYDWFQHLESSRTVHQKTPPVEIISSSSLSLTSQPQVSASQPQFSSEPSAQVTQPLLSAWSLYDTMLKTQDSAGIQSSVVMAITSSDVNSISSVVYKVNTKKRFISCRPGSCPAVTDICTPLVGGKFHCSCRQVGGFDVIQSMYLLEHPVFWINQRIFGLWWTMNSRTFRKRRPLNTYIGSLKDL